ncbi:d-tyrosyl-tRNA(Tyr) deacylase [Clostridium sp. CAG:575]|nr:d-tyrosyl-tRNA(Tyr) deacylase [Clostridium sp. CAG:575]
MFIKFILNKPYKNIIRGELKMRFLVQRVKKAQVDIDGQTVGRIEKGFLVLIGITHTDTKETADYLIKKLINLRVFEDENGKMNLGLKDVEGSLLLVSQFTLYADCTQGNRPSFTEAAKPQFANELYKYAIEKCKEQIKNVETGVFGADMQVSLINDGPVTIMLQKGMDF